MPARKLLKSCARPPKDQRERPDASMHQVVGSEIMGTGETIRRSEIWRDGSFQARVVERDGLVVSSGLARIGQRARTRRL